MIDTIYGIHLDSCCCFGKSLFTNCFSCKRFKMLVIQGIIVKRAMGPNSNIYMSNYQQGKRERLIKLTNVHPL